jgi:hypothetical protein
MDVVERFKTHSFEQKIERGDSRVTRCVDCIYIFLLSNLMDTNWSGYRFGYRVGQNRVRSVHHDSDRPAWGMRALFYGC